VGRKLDNFEYFLGVPISLNKRLSIALCSVYGIGSNQASSICLKLGFQSGVKFSDLNKRQKQLLRRFIESNFMTEFRLKQNVLKNIKAMEEAKTYKSIRRKKGYPVRGQKTRTNAVTCKLIKF
jgi:small subunit ribosomal protein S13